MQLEAVSPPDPDRELIDDRSTQRMRMQEAIVFARGNMDGRIVEELTGISLEEARREAMIRKGPMPYVPTPAEIAERARAVRLTRPGSEGLVARIQDAANGGDEQWP